MSDVIEIRLPEYDGKSWTFSREAFLRLYPESFIGLALQDTEAEVIDIVNPVITPYVMDYLTRLFAQNPPPSSSLQNLTQASRYLLMPIMGITSNPLYSGIQPLFVDINRNYLSIIVYGIQHNWMDLISYIWEQTEGGVDHTQDDTLVLLLSAHYDRLPVFLRIVERGVSPKVEVPYNVILPLIDPAFRHQVPGNANAVIISARSSARTVLKWLFDNISFDSSVWGEALGMGHTNRDYPVIDIVRSKADLYTYQYWITTSLREQELNTAGHILGVQEPITFTLVLDRLIKDNNYDGVYYLMRFSGKDPNQMTMAVLDNIDIIQRDVFNQIIAVGLGRYRDKLIQIAQELIRHNRLDLIPNILGILPQPIFNEAVIPLLDELGLTLEDVLV